MQFNLVVDTRPGAMKVALGRARYWNQRLNLSSKSHPPQC
jgi:hypothetical protein